MTSTADATDAFPIFRLEITDKHAIVLPPELRERLAVEAGDVLAVSVTGNQARVARRRDWTRRRRTTSRFRSWRVSCRHPSPTAKTFPAAWRTSDAVGKSLRRNLACEQRY